MLVKAMRGRLYDEALREYRKRPHEHIRARRPPRLPRYHPVELVLRRFYAQERGERKHYQNSLLLHAGFNHIQESGHLLNQKQLLKFR